MASCGRMELCLCGFYKPGFGNSCVQDGHHGAAVDLVANPIVFDLTSDVGFSLAINSVLRLRAGGVLIVALCCESFTVMYLDCMLNGCFMVWWVLTLSCVCVCC